MSAMRPRDWLFVSIVFALGLLCIRLGFWQLDRLQQRRERVARLKAQMAMPAVDLLQLSNALEEAEFRLASARGTFDHGNALLLRNRALNGVPGYHLVTPLLLAGSDWAVLVDRGWIEGGAEPRALLQRYRQPEQAAVEGLLLGSQSEPRLAFLADKVPGAGEEPLPAWRVLFIEGIAAQLPYNVLPLYLAQTEPLEGSGEQPIPQPEIDLTEGPHLSYAVQWFAFAATAFIGGGLWLRRRRRDRPQIVRSPQ